jgi:hypothetical protein
VPVEWQGKHLNFEGPRKYAHTSVRLNIAAAYVLLFLFLLLLIGGLYFGIAYGDENGYGFAVMSILVGVLVPFFWANAGSLKRVERAVVAFEEFFKRHDELKIQNFWVFGTWSGMIHALVQTTYKGWRFQFTMGLEPSSSSEISSSPTRYYFEARWDRPDELIVSKNIFYSDVTGMGELERFAMDEDYWQDDYDALFVDSVKITLKIWLLMAGKEASHLDELVRLERALEVFKEAMYLSIFHPGTYGPILKSKIMMSPDMAPMIGHLGHVYSYECSSCGLGARTAGSRQICSKCGSRLDMIVNRAGLGYTDAEMRRPMMEDYVKNSKRRRRES